MDKIKLTKTADNTESFVELMISSYLDPQRKQREAVIDIVEGIASNTEIKAQ
jgi:hypothetical protein